MPAELKRKEIQKSVSQDNSQQPAKRPRHNVCAHEGWARSLFHDPKYSDVTIVCGDESFRVHRCVVCPRSKFMAAACDGQFKEASSRRIELHNEEPRMVKRMLEYLYTLDYGVESIDRCLATLVTHVGETAPEAVSPASPTTTSDSLLFHIHMYLLADRLLIQGLKKVALKKLDDKLRQCLDAEAYRQTVVEIYQSSPPNDPSLRDTLVRATIACMAELRKRDGPGPVILPNSLLEDVPAFATDICIGMMNLVPQWRSK